MNRWVVALVVASACWATPAAAHVRAPLTISLHVRDAQHLLAGTTFGAVTSDDGGVTWRWTCEQGLHYQDPFDPSYAYAIDGAILMRTTVATWLKRDLCGDDVMPLTIGTSAVAASPDGALYAGAIDGTIFKATSSTATFQSLGVPATVDVWKSIAVAPFSAQRIYIAGTRLIVATGMRENALMMSTSGGASWTAMSTTGFPTSSSALLTIVGIGPATDTLYVYSPFEDDKTAAIYQSTNAGASWAKIFSSPDPYGLAFLVRASGELVVATRASGAWHSTDAGASWQVLAGAPHISALVETPTGEVWAGTQPFAQPPPPMNMTLPTIDADGYLLMHSSDLATWTPGLAMVDVQPTACPTGSPVREACVDMHYDLGTAWCCLVSEYRVDPGELDCRGANWCGGYLDAGVAGDTTPPSDPGCCQAGASPDAPIALALVLVWRRRRRPSR